ncbi:MAG: hypothetical protein J6B64_02985 [Bacilli bacterium]|nr:hypothetical protein [Bacilli bacterium]MBO5376346.1 hypothetical protein [Bacilli bacterium]MBP3597597.1 hypothetical protein [Clostridia bacterium]
MKKRFMIGTALIGLMLSASPVEAMGNATVTFSGNNNVKVGETFTVSMNVSDIKDTYDGVVSMGGNILFDNTKLEYVSSKEVNAPYQFQTNKIGEGNYKLAGLDMTLANGIYNTTTVYEITFKAIDEGNTSISLNDARLTDSQSYIDTTVITKNISIEKEEPVVIENIAPVKENVVVKQTVNNNVEKVEKIEKETKVEEVINKPVKVEKINVEVKEVTQEKETIFKKAQNLFSNFLSQIKNLFR